MEIALDTEGFILLFRKLFSLNVSECAQCFDVVILYIDSLLYHVSDVFNKVVLNNVIRKIKGDMEVFSLYFFTFDLSVLRITPTTKNNLCSGISVNSPFITIFRKENDNQETDNCMECDDELCRGA